MTVYRLSNRSIPASAGQPGLNFVNGRTERVYPRECGATLGSTYYDPAKYGLSPRVRGNRTQSTTWAPSPRSIPASAGQPVASSTGPPGIQVYPRECGATGRTPGEVAGTGGLSPRVRGNQSIMTVYRLSNRSIPASAGQPTIYLHRLRYNPVYPRECGATDSCIRPGLHMAGLSPRVRGNQVAIAVIHSCLGSIPASAGQPASATLCCTISPVYPRECGATQTPFILRSLWRGLSPRVRGNPSAVLWPRTGLRSIPASAGQPWAKAVRRPAVSVYPRECGATNVVVSIWPVLEGLSPRVRGNHLKEHKEEIRTGSIPASAGQPS